MDEIRCCIEVRADESRQSPGRLYGVLMKYGTKATDRPEVFEPGSLKWPDSGVVLNRQHSRAAPIMRVLPITEGNVVRIDAPLPDTSAGRDAAREIRGAPGSPPLFRGLSVEFKDVRQTFVGGVRRITSAVLTGAGLVDAPSYPESSIEVRAKRRQVWL